MSELDEQLPFTLTEEAANKVSELLSRYDRDDLRLRVSVQPGGCSGLIYQTFFDARLLEEDILDNILDFEVVVDRLSAPYLQGATIGYNDTIEEQGFTMANPNATGSCACGDSFS